MMCYVHQNVEIQLIGAGWQWESQHLGADCLEGSCHSCLAPLPPSPLTNLPTRPPTQAHLPSTSAAGSSSTSVVPAPRSAHPASTLCRCRASGVVGTAGYLPL